MISVLIFQAFSGGEKFSESWGIGSNSWYQIIQQSKEAAGGKKGFFNNLAGFAETMFTSDVEWIVPTLDDESAQFWIDKFNQVYLDDSGVISWDKDSSIDSNIVWTNKLDICTDTCYINVFSSYCTIMMFICPISLYLRACQVPGFDYP